MRTGDCQKLAKFEKRYMFSSFDKCFKHFSPPDWNPKNNRRDKFWINLGFGVFLNAEGVGGFAMHVKNLWADCVEGASFFVLQGNCPQLPYSTTH